MSDMFPEDIWLRAENCLPVGTGGDAGIIELLRHNIQQALLAERIEERERIAAFIEQRPGSIPERQEIASAIRRGTP